MAHGPQVWLTDWGYLINVSISVAFRLAIYRPQARAKSGEFCRPAYFCRVLKDSFTSRQHRMLHTAPSLYFSIRRPKSDTNLWRQPQSSSALTTAAPQVWDPVSSITDIAYLFEFKNKWATQKYTILYLLFKWVPPCRLVWGSNPHWLNTLTNYRIRLTISNSTLQQTCNFHYFAQQRLQDACTRVTKTQWVVALGLSWVNRLGFGLVTDLTLPVITSKG